MAYGLIMLHKETKVGEWVHLRKFFTERNIRNMNDLPTVRHWNLLQKSSETKEDGNPNSGLHRITYTGREFVCGRIQMPRNALIFNDSFKGFSGEMTNIKKALGDKFNYSELMPKIFITRHCEHGQMDLL